MIYKRPEEELFTLLNSLNIPKVGDRPDLFYRGVSIAPEGLYLEFGVHTGRSMRELLYALADRKHKVYGFDVFTKPMPDDFTEFWGKGIFAIPIDAIPKFNPEEAELLIGYYGDTLPAFLEEHPEPVAFVHMDSDIYISTKYVLNTLSYYNRILTGTVIQFDDLFVNEKGYWYNGEYLAFTEWANERNIKYRYLAKYVTQATVVIE